MMCSLKNTTAIVAVIAAASIIISTSTVDAFSNTQIPSSPLSVSETSVLFARRAGGGGGGGGSTMGGGGGRSGGGGSGGNDYDYSGGNLKYGTGKYTQRANDGHNGGVNVSKNGRSMQDSVYREDRENVDRARGRPRDMDDMEDMGRGGPPMGGMEGGGGGNNDFGSRMGELEDMERDMGMRGQRGGPRGDRDEFMDMEGGGEGARDRMGGRGGGLLRDMHGGRDRDGYDEFGSRGGGGMMTNSNGRGK
jgi:hypothetical protein